MPTNIVGNVKDLSGTASTSGVSVRLSLKWAGGGTPRVNGTALVTPAAGTSGPDRVVYPLTINTSTGAITGSVYSTRDAAGTGNGEIEVNGSLVAVYYEVQVIISGRRLFSFPVHAKNGVTLDLTNVTPITVDPIVAAPTGDTTYARLDGGNQPFTGQVVGKNGAVGSPSFAFASSLTTGFWRQAADVIGVSIAGVLEWLANASGILFSSGDSVAWSSNADPSLAAGDSFLSRLGAGIVGVGTAIGNALGTLRVAILQIGGSDTGLSRDSAGVIDIGNGTQGDKSGNLKLATLTLGKSDGTLPATFTNDTAGGINFTSNSGKFIEFNTQGQIVFFGSISGTTIVAPSAAASGTLTFPAATDTLVGKATADTFTNKGFGDKITLYNNIATVSNGIASEVATVDLTAQTANIGSTTLYAVPASGAGTYRVTVYIIVTSVGTTSTMPNVVIGFTDPDNNTVQSVPYTVSSTGNSLTTLAVNSLPLRAKASTNITYSTTGYASSGSAMQYAVHIKLEVL